MTLAAGTLLSFGLLFALAAQTPSGVDAVLWQKALAIHKKAIVVDTHNDVTMKLFHENLDIGVRHKEGHFDLPRAKEGGLSAEFFSIFIPNSKDDQHPAKYALDLIDAVYESVRKNPQKAGMAFTAADIRRLKKEGKLAVLMGMENGSPVEHSLGLLRDFYRLGVRYITLTHSSNNYISDSSFDTKPRWHGLSDFGKAMVREMNRLGMLVDISHLADAAARDVLAISQTPVIASHSALRHFCNIHRNMPDHILKSLAKNGGVVQINFFSGFLSQKFWDRMTELKKELEPKIDALKEKYKDDENAYWNAYGKLFEPYELPVPDVSAIVDEIDYAVKIAGSDHVGLGSDFDGVTSLPKGMEDVTHLPMITYLLLKRGYSESDILKILGGNLLRVMEANEKFAQEHR